MLTKSTRKGIGEIQTAKKESEKYMFGEIKKGKKKDKPVFN